MLPLARSAQADRATGTQAPGPYRCGLSVSHRKACSRRRFGRRWDERGGVLNHLRIDQVPPVRSAVWVCPSGDRAVPVCVAEVARLPMPQRSEVWRLPLHKLETRSNRVVGWVDANPQGKALIRAVGREERDVSVRLIAWVSV